MKKVSRLSQECIKNRGLCCERRVNVIFTDKEAKNLSNKKIVQKCKFFREPFCMIYSKRPIDCRSYPITIDLRGSKPVFVIDLKCPAVRKGIIDRRFINRTIRLWEKNWPSKSWLKKNAEDNRNKKIYDWMTLERYLVYRKQLKK
jgi:Fe-S-cluster containining protein